MTILLRFINSVKRLFKKDKGETKEVDDFIQFSFSKDHQVHITYSDKMTAEIFQKAVLSGTISLLLANKLGDNKTNTNKPKSSSNDNLHYLPSSFYETIINE